MDGRRVFGWRFGLGWPDDAVGDGGGLAAGFVGVDAVVTDSLTSSMRSGSDSAVGEGEAGAKGILKGGGGSVEQEGEEVAAFAEDAVQDLGDGEDELAVGDFVADGVGDPLASGAGATLVIFWKNTEKTAAVTKGHNITVMQVCVCLTVWKS